jgi:alkylation response protein AidB-like acyl-CoA dehydrogenase
MDFNLSQEQEILKKTARDFFSKESSGALVRAMEQDEKGYSPELWRKVASLGWLGLPYPGEFGGADGSFLDLAALLEELGRSLAPVPIFGTVVLGGLPIAKYGTAAQKKAFLPALSSGESIATFAIAEPGSSYSAKGINLKATASGSGYKLNGTKIFVENANIANVILVAARTAKGKKLEEGITVFIVDRMAPGVTVEALKPISLEKQSEVTFKNVSVGKDRILGKPGKGWPIVKQTMQWAIAGQAVMAAGGAQGLLETTVEYTKGRVQFGRPIATLQAVQHHAANIVMDVDTMRLVAYEAAWLLSEGRPCDQEIAMAKGYVANAYTRMTREAIQIHGGIGFTKEMNAQLYFRRAKGWEQLYGGPDQQREIVAQSLGF